MDNRNIEVNISVKDTPHRALLCINEHDDDRIEFVLEFENTRYDVVEEDHFSSMLSLRRKMELSNMKLLCKGASRNVYPSPMQFSMGNTLKAYNKKLGKQALKSDLVDIFQPIGIEEYSSLEEQKEFQDNWIKSLR